MITPPGRHVLIRQVIPTSIADHQRLGRPYVAVIGPAMAESLQFRRRPTGLNTLVIGRCMDDLDQPLAVVASGSVDPRLPEGHVRFDQTLRTALGLPVSGTALEAIDSSTFVAPLHHDRRAWLNNLCSGLIGRRYLLLRVTQPDPNDIEKSLCRVEEDDLAAAGSQAGSRLVFFAPRWSPSAEQFELARCSLQALRLDETTVDRRRSEEQRTDDERWDARYRSARALLNVEPDLSYAMIDADARSQLGIDRAWPVLVRRDSLSVVAAELLEFGVTLLASLLAVQSLAEPLLGNFGWTEFASSLTSAVVSLMIAFTLVVIRLRADIK